MKSDIEISQEAKLKIINDIAKSINIEEKYMEQYGKYKAKIDLSLLEETKSKNGKIILVTAINPTPAGEGKTTTSIGLADGIKKLGKNVVLALREPSLGPVFGVKGGATGGGYAQVAPMEDINLHFTGDFHAIGAANNLLAAMIDNHIYHGNELHINPQKITWKRCVDMNDRQLRKVIDGVGNGTNGVEREDGYDITVASEIMAVFCLASSIEDLKKRLSKIVIGYNEEDMPVTAGDLKAEGAMTALLKDAFKPNLVQTLEGTPAFIHGGPFANIAHGCNSLIATKMATHVADYVVTEAGFGGDLGAEKFLDIKCRIGNIKPSAVVVVATIRALKMHGGLSKEELQQEDLVALEKGIPNLLRHISNMKNVYGLPTVVTLNKFTSDTQNEINLVMNKCQELGIDVVLSEVWEKGGEGGKALAEKVLELCENPSHFRYSYELDEVNCEDNEKEKLATSPSNTENKNREVMINHMRAIVQKVYGGKDVELSEKAGEQIKILVNLGYANLPICIAKTQYSFSDNPKILGAPEDFMLHVKEVKLSAGAGFIVVLAGNIMTMPGLPKVPAAEKIDVDANGKIVGLF